MSDFLKNSPLPVKVNKTIGVKVPLDQAIANPKTVTNTTPKTYITIPGQPPPQKVRQ